MSDHEVPEAFRTAKVVRRRDAETGIVVFNDYFVELFHAYDQLLPHAYTWMLQQDVTDFPYVQPKGWRRPPHAVKDPSCPGVQIPGTDYGISTMHFLIHIQDGRARRVEPEELSRHALTQLVNAMNRLQPTKRRQ